MEFNEVENLSDAQILELYSDVVESSQANLIAANGVHCNPGDVEIGENCWCNNIGNGQLGYPVEWCSTYCRGQDVHDLSSYYSVGHYYYPWKNSTYMCGKGVK